MDHLPRFEIVEENVNSVPEVEFSAKDREVCSLGLGGILGAMSL